MESVVWIADLYGIATNIKKCERNTISGYEVVFGFDAERRLLDEYYRRCEI